MEVPSLGGSRYYMLLVDDFSRKLWVYFLTHKSDALPNFQHWLRLTEKQSNSKVSTLRSDNGGEFIAFEDFLASNGILHQTSLPYTPQQNGVVERKNRTVKEPGAKYATSCKPSFFLLGRSYCHFRLPSQPVYNQSFIRYDSRGGLF